MDYRYLIKYNKVDCENFEDIVGKKVAVEKLEDLTGIVNHVGMGGVQKLTYVNDKGKRRYVLERTQYYAQDAWVTEIWQFRYDFTADEAKVFVESFDKENQK